MAGKSRSSKVVAEAQRLAQAQQLRLTPIRQSILELLANADKAMGAYEILAAMQKDKPDFKPVTVYRTLEFFLEHGLVHRIESSNAYMICDHPGHEHRSQLLICDSCGYVKEVEASAVSTELDKAARKAGFTKIRQTVETHGLCRSCRA